ncbi:piggyBac transposable element-derived protein 2-like [Stegodyphus dumicola]|uniref:piggyBac transposable element-derived protein 2-like n=1 Tax=Stegodyphus dumicola TaxID=202533 RepID=UPI0015A7D3ED|nr:piggyBac transposable element-derived protein 2-like [Stegodyphus dumicola]
MMKALVGLGHLLSFRWYLFLTLHPHKVYFDSFFTGFSLMKYLQDIDVRATGTVRFNRMNKRPIATDKEIRKKERGAYDYRFDSRNEILAVTWNDNSCVRLLSNHETIEPISKMKRWSRTEKTDIHVQKIQNQNKGEAKWSKTFLKNAIDITLVNAPALYCISNDKITLLDFRRMVARGYLALSSELSDGKKDGRNSFTKASINCVPLLLSEYLVIHYIEQDRKW